MENTIYNNPYGFIYITTNMINGKKYLGQRKFHRNWQEYLGSGTALKRAIKKYGKENFERNIVCICCSLEELNQAEYNLSVFLNVVESPDWYNLKYGGGSMMGYSPSLETRKKISRANKGRPAPNKGIPMSEEAKRKQREAQSGEKSSWYGKKHTDETKQKIREKHIGTQASQETKSKMSQQRQGKNNYDAKPIVQLTIEGVFIRDWDYLRQAARELHINEASICMCCRKQHKTAGGFRWVYAKEYYNNIHTND